MLDTDLTIPPFLRVDAAEAERRRQWWTEHPPKPMATFSKPREVDPDVAAFAAKKEARTREATRVRLEALRAKKAGQEPARTVPEGYVWSPHVGDFVDPTRMSRAKYDRIMSEMPTPEHKRVFAEMYGDRVQGAPVESPRREARLAANEVVRSANKAKAAQNATVVRPLLTTVVMSGTKPATGKHATLLDLLRRPQGATLQEIADATGWQTHTAQARIGGVRKMYDVPVAKEDRGTVYRLLTKDPGST